MGGSNELISGQALIPVGGKLGVASSDLQRKPLGRTGRVVIARGMNPHGYLYKSAYWRQVAVRLTAPSPDYWTILSFIDLAFSIVRASMAIRSMKFTELRIMVGLPLSIPVHLMSDQGGILAASLPVRGSVSITITLPLL